MSKSTLLSLFSSLCLFCSSFNLFAQATCTIPPTAIVGALNVTRSAATVPIRAIDFDIASYSTCSGIAAFSFSPDITDTEKNFDCFQNGAFQQVTIFITDTDGNQTIARTEILIEDRKEICMGTNGPSACEHDFLLNSEVAIALSNNNTATIGVNNLIKRVEEDCVGNPIINFRTGFAPTRTFGTADVGGTAATLLLDVNGVRTNEAFSFVDIQAPLSTASCIPVPIVYEEVYSSLGVAGNVIINAAMFDLGSYSDCGGNVELSFSADVNDTQRSYLGGAVFSGVYLDIWVTDSQTGTQNKVAAELIIEDLIAPICAALPDIQGSCADYQEGMFGASTDMDGDEQFEAGEYISLSGDLLAVYNANFGAPVCIDNNSEVFLLLEQEYQLIATSCGLQIKRRFRATDPSLNVSPWTIQNIQYSTVPDWKVTFPANVALTCGDEFPAAAISIETGNCNALTHNVTEEMTTNPSGTTRLERTYSVFNSCLDFAGADTIHFDNVANGLMITDDGNENLIAFIYVQYLDIIDENRPILEITSPDPCISGIDFDAFPLGEEDVSPGTAPFECDQIKTWRSQGIDDCDANLDITGKIMIDGNTILEVAGASMSFVVEPSVSYTVQFTAIDDFGNLSISTQEYTFFDCVQPTVQLRGNSTYNLPASGALTISSFEFDHASFDNCTDQFKLDFRIWRDAAGTSAPTTLDEILALPTFLTFDIGNVGTNVLRIYVIDEAGNWSYAETFAILNDASNCNTTPFNLPVSITNFSSRDASTKVWGAATNLATSPINWTGSLFEDGTLVSQVDTNFLIFNTTSDKEYTVAFVATDACNNTGADTLIQNFSACNQAPNVRVVDGLSLNLNANGAITIFAAQLNNGSFDNCTSGDKLVIKAWSSFMGPRPQTLEEVNQLSSIMTFTCSSLGTVEVALFVINESGNFASASTFVTVQDNNQACFIPPPPNPDPCSETSLNLTGTISVDSTYQTQQTITSTATIAANTNVTFQAGQSVTLNTGFHAVAGSAFIAKIETCSTQTLIEPTSEERQVTTTKIAVNPSRPMPIEQAGMALNIYPNPFRGATTIDYFIPETGSTTIQLRDFLGRKVATLANNEQKEEGWYQLQLNAQYFPAGTYYLVLSNEGQVKTTKLILIK